NSHQFYSITIKSSNPTSKIMALSNSFDKFHVVTLLRALGFALSLHSLDIALRLVYKTPDALNALPFCAACKGTQGTKSCEPSSCVVGNNQPWASAIFKNCGENRLDPLKGSESTGRQVLGAPTFTVHPKSYGKFPGGLDFLKQVLNTSHAVVAVLDVDFSKGWHACLEADNAINAQRASQYLSASNQIVTFNLIRLF
ncbi:hypothetical protein MJO29_011103, partial [Puccinia striiformis f. sp. tritici]